jgi:hypothetical protein
MQLSHFHPMVRGEWRLSLPIVCQDGGIRKVVIEEYVEGFCAALTKDDGKVVSNNVCYPTSLRAIHAAAKY